jgi:GNAT superfamily N-acetyltransferase
LDRDWAGQSLDASPERTAVDDWAESPQGRQDSAVPCFLLARLAVDVEWQGKGLGWGLLQDALKRVLLLSQSVAAPALLVHARDETARAFYLHHAEFLQSPVDPLHLVLPMKAIASAIQDDD